MLDEPRENLSPSDREIVEAIEEFGFYSITVGQSEEDASENPEWSYYWTYSIGLFASYGHAEVVIFTLPQETAHAVLWDLANAIESGSSLDTGNVYRDILPSFPAQMCAFEAVSGSWAASLFCYAEWFYRGQEFPVVSYIWPDRDGRFVWDDGVARDLIDVQPCLREPPTTPAAPPPRRG